MKLAIVLKVFTAAASAVVAILLVWPILQAQAPGANSPNTAVLHATVTITGGLTFTGSYDDRLPVRTCADVARSGTGQSGGTGGAMFNVPIPPPNPGGNPGSVSGGHTFSTDVAAWPYRGPATYTGPGLTATQMDVDTRPDDQETHVFAFPTAVGTLTVNPDASGSFQFTGLQDPGSVKISGHITWTCS